MKRTLLAAVLIAALAPLATGCRQGSRVQQGKTETGVSTGQREAGTMETAETGQMKETLADFRQKAEQKLDEYGKRIDELEQSAGKTTGEARERLEAAVDNLKEKREEVSGELEELKTAGMESWEQAKEKIQSTMDELEKDINEAMASLK